MDVVGEKKTIWPQNLAKIEFVGSNALFSISCTYYSSFEQICYWILTILNHLGPFLTSLGPELSIILHRCGPFGALLNHLTTYWGLTLVFFYLSNWYVDSSWIISRKSELNDTKMIQIKYKNTRGQSECYLWDLMYNSGQISECHGFLKAYDL